MALSLITVVANTLAARSGMRGRFLVLEGIDGCGKTQLKALADWLPASGLSPAGAQLITTREPGGTALGQALRGNCCHPPRSRPQPHALNCCSMRLIAPNMCKPLGACLGCW